jgi:hypothetical protein
VFRHLPDHRRAWNLGHILLAQGQPDGAEDVAIGAVEDLERNTADGDLDARAMAGALWLVAVVDAVRNNDPWTARDRLREKAWPAAQVTGETNVMWTVFGPTNVQLHAVSVEMEMGEASEALRLADGRRWPGLVPVVPGPGLEVPHVAPVGVERGRDGRARVAATAARDLPDLRGYRAGVRGVTVVLASRPKRRVFAGSHDQVRQARDFVARTVGASPAADDAVLLVSELATNAVTHTASGMAGSSRSPCTRPVPGSGSRSAMRVRPRRRPSGRTRSLANPATG